MNDFDMTIAAVSTPPGVGGIAVVRLSGPKAFAIADSVWKGARLSDAPSHTAHLGELTDLDGSVLDQCVATVFAEGKSFTGEPTVEFSVHGSRWIQRRVVERLIEAGASAAGAGEFTRRAFLNGRIDLAQAEGIADMIAASSKAAQRLAAQQMKGGFSKRLNALRDRMIELASLIELELDFSEEDVEFADRSRLLGLARSARNEIERLADSFHAGRVLKEGVAVVIAGIPNAGKSTLLNNLLQDDKAIVSDIAGTTRDVIEDTAEIDGILFRFIDTAGLRDTDNDIERIGVDRARQRISSADILLWLIDPTVPEGIAQQLDEYRATTALLPSSTPRILLLNKCDAMPDIPALPDNTNLPDLPVLSDLPNLPAISDLPNLQDLPSLPDFPDLPNIPNIREETIRISARSGAGIQELTARLTAIASDGHDPGHDLIVTNARHYESLRSASSALLRVERALSPDAPPSASPADPPSASSDDTASYPLPPDLIAQDLRAAIHHLGAITGAITPADLLHTIFSRFCIGK